jgi:hypothetical protein
LTIPANSSGRLPLAKEQAESYQLDGQALSKSGRIHAANKDSNELEYELPAGSYRFEIALPSVN